MAYSIYLDNNGKLYSNNKFVDIDNILLLVNGTFVSLDGSNAMGDIGLVTKQDVIALEGRIDNHTLLLADKLDQTAFDALAATKADKSEALTPTDLANIITETPTVNLTATSVLEKSTTTFVITNYNSSYTYSIGSDIGTVDIDSSGTVTFVANEVDGSTPGYIKISAVDGNKLISFPLIINLTVENIPYVADDLLVNGDLFSNAQEINGMV